MKKILSSILSLLLLLSVCSCNVTIKSINNTYNLINNIETATSTDYLNAILNYHVRDKNINNTVDNEKFDEFLDEYFLSCFDEDSYTYLYSNFYDYTSYNIEKPEVTLGHYIYDDQKYIDEEIDILNKLHSFDYDSLSYTQQFEYETLEYSMLESLSKSTSDFKWHSVFGDNGGYIYGTVIFLNDFKFRNKEYLDDYMILIEDFERYLNDSIEYTNKAANEGNYYLTDYDIDNTEKYIDSFVGSKTNALVKSFNDKIKDVDFLSSKEKKDYIERNEAIVTNNVIPAVLKARDCIESHRGKTTSRQNIIRNLSDELTESFSIVAVSYNKTIDEMYLNAINVYNELNNELKILANDETVKADIERINNGEVYPLGKDYDSILEFLEENYTLTHPNIGYIEYDLSPIDKSAASDSINAYYRPSPIDKPNLNIIRYNENNLSNKKTWRIYFNVAHEAIPGHMYDYYRYFLSDNHPIMRVLSYGGVTEGYAKYSELCAASYLDIDDKTKRYISLDVVNPYIYYGIFDLAINYYNKDDKELLLLANHLGSDVNDFDDYIDSYNSNYFTYIEYGIGLANILTIKKNTQEALGDQFNEVEFNDLLTKHGTLPLVIIEDEINKYVAKKLNNN